MAKQKDWFKTKKYPHIGMPLKSIDRKWVTSYVTNENSVETHSFYPFIHRNSTTRKFRKQLDRQTGEKSDLRYASSKPRELYYANHLDSCVYSYYASILNIEYDKKLANNGLNEVVTAYRRIKLNPSILNSVHKSSADFASDVFNYILSSEQENLVAITFDIKGFFDNLDHKLLKKAWYQLTPEKTCLSSAEFNVFNNITNFAFVNENQLFNEFKNEILTETKSGIQKKKEIKKIHHMRKQGAIAFCELSDIKRIKSRKLIIGNGKSNHKKRIKGIPQGSPISAVLANVYMFDFDEKINKIVDGLGGIYRRYSDDMIVICEGGNADAIIKMFDEEIGERKLEVQHDKTQIFKFTKKDNKFFCEQQLDGVLYPHKNLEYLGFEFDGFNTFLKSSSLSSYYRKMKRSYRRGLYYSKTLKVSKSVGQIFKTRLFKKFSYKGAGRRRIYKPDKLNPGNWVKTESYNWGNYISYAQLAANKLPNNKIKGQIKRHWKILNELLNS